MKHNKEKLSISQKKKTVRIIANLRYNAHTEYYFTNFSIIKITNFYYYRHSIVYKDAVIKGSTYFLNTFPLNVRTPSHET